jgi:hypothetical protein
MAYQQNIPQLSDPFNQSQAAILGNFQALAPVGNGYLQLTQLGAAPTVTGTNIALYQSPTGGVVLSNPTASTVVDFTTAVLGASGWTRLPSGLMVQWAQTGNLVLGANTINFFSGKPFLQGPWSIQLTCASTNATTGGDPNCAYSVYGITLTSFKIWVTTRNGGTLAVANSAYWVAIGA